MVTKSVLQLLCWEKERTAVHSRKLYITTGVATCFGGNNRYTSGSGLRTFGKECTTSQLVPRFGGKLASEKTKDSAILLCTFSSRKLSDAAHFWLQALQGKVSLSNSQCQISCYVQMDRPKCSIPLVMAITWQVALANTDSMLRVGLEERWPGTSVCAKSTRNLLDIGCFSLQTVIPAKQF